MSGSIALPILLALAVGGVAFVRRHARRRGTPQRLLRDLSPVSGQWLDDYRRSG